MRFWKPKWGRNKLGKPKKVENNGFGATSWVLLFILFFLSVFAQIFHFFPVFEKTINNTSVLISQGAVFVFFLFISKNFYFFRFFFLPYFLFFLFFFQKNPDFWFWNAHFLMQMSFLMLLNAFFKRNLTSFKKHKNFNQPQKVQAPFLFSQDVLVLEGLGIWNYQKTGKNFQTQINQTLFAGTFLKEGSLRVVSKNKQEQFFFQLRHFFEAHLMLDLPWKILVFFVFFPFLVFYLMLQKQEDLFFIILINLYFLTCFLLLIFKDYFEKTALENRFLSRKIDALLHFLFAKNYFFDPAHFLFLREKKVKNFQTFNISMDDAKKIIHNFSSFDQKIQQIKDFWEGMVFSKRDRFLVQSKTLRHFLGKDRQGDLWQWRSFKENQSLVLKEVGEGERIDYNRILLKNEKIKAVLEIQQQYKNGIVSFLQTKNKKWLMYAKDQKEIDFWKTHYPILAPFSATSQPKKGVFWTNQSGVKNVTTVAFTDQNDFLQKKQDVLVFGEDVYDFEERFKNCKVKIKIGLIFVMVSLLLLFTAFFYLLQKGEKIIVFWIFVQFCLYLLGLSLRFIVNKN